MFHERFKWCPISHYVNEVSSPIKSEKRLLPPSAPSDLTAPASRACLHALALADLHCGLVVDSGRAHPLLDLAGHGQEGLLNIRRVLGGCLEERDAQAVGKFLLDHVVSERHQSLVAFILTLATVYSTTFLSDISLLLPTSSLLTPSVA